MTCFRSSNREVLKVRSTTLLKSNERNCEAPFLVQLLSVDSQNLLKINSCAALSTEISPNFLVRKYSGNAPLHHSLHLLKNSSLGKWWNFSIWCSAVHSFTTARTFRGKGSAKHLVCRTFVITNTFSCRIQSVAAS